MGLRLEPNGHHLPDGVSSHAAGQRLRIAVVGAGISGLSAAWLLSKSHDVTIFESEPRAGGHSNTVDVKDTPVDTGFIVYNDATYPNLVALLDHLGVPTFDSDMSFAVSIDDGRLEYSGTGLAGLFAQKRNALSPRFWRMLVDLMRFYAQARRMAEPPGDMSLARFLAAGRYGCAFREDHLLPMAAAIWSTPAKAVGDYPAAAFIRFFQNHGLLQLRDRPIWRTVRGGSRAYVQKLLADFSGTLRLNSPIAAILRDGAGITVVDAGGARAGFDHVVLATPADVALRLLESPSADERRLLCAFGYTDNHAILHSDPALMPKRRAAWASWNYLSARNGIEQGVSVTYWMNLLQALPHALPLFVTLNPLRAPAPETVHWQGHYRHPHFTAAAMEAQRDLWRLQGAARTWFCGAYFGSGFHEDGLQAGLAVAEALGGQKRPWHVAAESGRIFLGAGKEDLGPGKEARNATEQANPAIVGAA